MAGDWLNQLSIEDKGLRQKFRIIAALVLLVPFGVLAYILHENDALASLAAPGNVLMLGLAVIVVLAVLAILQSIFIKLDHIAGAMRRAAEGESVTIELGEQTREIREITESFNRLLSRYERTSRELEKLSHVLMAMKEMTEAASRSLDLGELLSLLLEKSMVISGASTGAVFARRGNEEALELVELKGADGERRRQQEAIYRRLARRVAGERRMFRIERAVADPRLAEVTEPETADLSMLCVPVLVDTQMRAVLCLASDAEPFTDREGELVASMLGEVRFALENAVAHDTIRQHDRKLTERASELSEEINHRKRVEQQLEFLAYRDKLTGLVNRYHFMMLLDQLIAQARRKKQKLAVLFLDLDRFKIINDSMGHGVGDAVLQEAARRMQGCLRQADVIARYGGDEFAFALLEVEDAPSVATVADKVLGRLAQPYLLRGDEYFISASIGTSIYPENGDGAEHLLRCADAAMYEAKKAGGNSHRFFTPELGEVVAERMQIEFDMHHALPQHEFVLQYQPQVELAGGGLEGIEALLRWKHPRLGMLAPDRFVPLAEQTGLIIPIGRWVLADAARQYGAWRDAGLLPESVALHVTVNVSARQFRREDFADSLEEVLRETGIDPHMLELEITESAIMQAEELAVPLLHELKERGVRLAIDDFGKGFSSLGYLKRFPVDTLKIDQSFVRHLPGDRSDAAIVHAILDLAHSLDIRVVAEGVETEEQLRFLLEQGCHSAQGFLFAPPLSASDVTPLLREGEARQRDWRHLLARNGG